jgi:hypothetical protein
MGNEALMPFIEDRIEQRDREGQWKSPPLGRYNSSR